jgi:DNA-binding response OmpR family regulator
MLSEMSPRVLLVEDDDAIARPLVRTLEREGYEVERVDHGQAALAAIEGEGAPHLMILDLGLPDIDGLEVCRRARDAGYDGSIMILTARGGELDRVVGLDTGADDYLAKPFPLSEMLARVRALLRRVGQAEATPSANRPTPPPPAVTVATTSPTTPPTSGGHELRVDGPARRVWSGAQEIQVSAKEFDILVLLDGQPGAVVTRERLMDEVWDTNWFGSTRTLDATIGRLRQKLEEHQVPVRIDTVRGVGFRMERDSPDA